jgi:hypothetical protein
LRLKAITNAAMTGNDVIRIRISAKFGLSLIETMLIKVLSIGFHPPWATMLETLIDGIVLAVVKLIDGIISSGIVVSKPSQKKKHQYPVPIIPIARSHKAGLTGSSP